MTVRVGVDCDYTEGCCGVRQLTCFSDTSNAQWREFKASGKTEQEAWQNLLNELNSYSFSDCDNDYACSVLQIWFVKLHDYQKVDNEQYEAQPFMDLIAAMPNVVCLGEYRNVNSGNLIKGYQWAVA